MNGFMKSDPELQQLVGTNTQALVSDRFRKVASPRGTKYTCYQHNSLPIRIHEDSSMQKSGQKSGNGYDYKPSAFLYVEINVGDGWGWKRLGTIQTDYCFDIQSGLAVIQKYLGDKQ